MQKISNSTPQNYTVRTPKKYDVKKVDDYSLKEQPNIKPKELKFAAAGGAVPPPPPNNNKSGKDFLNIKKSISPETIIKIQNICGDMNKATRRIFNIYKKYSPKI